jgi:AcrR family transcriptional regulator
VEQIAVDVARRSLVGRERVAVDEVQRLIAAGIQVMAESPKARVGDIVRAAGLSNSAFYRYFHSKDELIAAILRDGTRRLADYLRHQMAKHRDPGDQVEAWVTGVLDQGRNPDLAEPTRAVLVQGHHIHAAVGPGATARGDGLRELLQAPLVALGRPDPERDAVVITEGVLGQLFRHFQRAEPVTDADIAHAVTFYRAAIRAPAPATGPSTGPSTGRPPGGTEEQG